MIHYSMRSPRSYLRWRGSVIPKAMLWATPCALLSCVYHLILHRWSDWASTYLEELTPYETTGWGHFTSILGFLIGFRAQLSYHRYWEGITLVEQEFQYVLSRLVSLMLSYVFEDISELDRRRFPTWTPAASTPRA